MKHPLIKLTEYLNGISGNIRIWSGQDSASIVPFPFHRYRSLNLNVRRKTPLPRYFAAETTRSFWGLCCVCYRICVHKKLLCFCSDSCRIVFLTMVKEFFYTQRTRRKKIQEREKEKKKTGEKEKEGKEQNGKEGKNKKRRPERRKRKAEKRGKGRTEQETKKRKKWEEQSGKEGKSKKRRSERRKREAEKRKKEEEQRKERNREKKEEERRKKRKREKRGRSKAGKTKRAKKGQKAENRKRTKWKKHKFSSTTRPLPFFPGTKKDRPGSYAPSCLKHIHSFKVSVRRFRRYCRRSVPSRCRKG